MKIRIDDEYSNEGGDFNIILDEYSQGDEFVDVDNNIERESAYYSSGNKNTYEDLDTGEFNVKIQYSEELGEQRYTNSKESESLMVNMENNNNDSLEYEEPYESFSYEEEAEEEKYEDEISCKDDDYYNEEKTYSTDIINDYEDDYKNNYEETCKAKKGKIKVIVKLGDKNGVEIKGAKINLYELNGVCPKLYESKLTKCQGEAIFENLEDGCYRVISLVDRRFFEKPSYVNWNEVTIDSNIKEATIYVVNKVKPSCYKR